MKKKLFDKKIYLEGLRQTRVMGIFLAVLMVVGSALFPIFTILDYYSDTGFYIGVDLIPITDFAPLLIPFMFLGPIALTMQQFSFLNKRNSSDFYHALPCTRTCLYFSFSASVLTWVTGIILATVMVNGLLYIICPVTTVTLSVMLYTFATYFCGSLLVMAVMLLAKSITGTALSNIIAGGIIGFLPRLLALVFVSIYTELVPIVEVSKMGYFLNTAYNIPVNFAFGFFTGLDSSALSFIDGMVSTFLLAVVYFVIALLVFQRRKSETAQQSAPNRILQHVIRCLITLPITLVLPVLFFQETLDGGTTIAILFIAAIIYFGYELLSTKKVKNLLTALPLFLAVILFDVLFGAALIGAQAVILSDTPGASEIDSVSVSLQPNSYYLYDHYNLLLAKDCYIEDDAMVKSVADALERSVNAIKDDTYYNKLYGDNSYFSFPVAIRKQNGTVMNRILLFTGDEVEQLNAIYEADKGYQKKLTQLPERKSITNMTVHDIAGAETAEKIWELYSKEYEKLSYEDKLIANGIGEYLGISSPNLSNLTISVMGYYGVTPYAVDYHISQMTPETYALCLELANKGAKDGVQLFWEEVGTIEGQEEDILEYNLYFNSVSGEQSCYFNLSLEQKGIYFSGNHYAYAEMEELFSTLQEATKRDAVDFTQPIYCINFRRSQWDSKNGGTYVDEFTVYFNLTEAEFEVLNHYITEVDEIYEV